MSTSVDRGADETRVLSKPRVTRDEPSRLLVVAPVAALIVMLIGYVRHAAQPISDPDTLWHILAGQHLAATWQFNGPDPLSSFTSKGWVLNQWPVELGFFWAHELGGLAAVAWLAHAGRLALVVGLYLTCRTAAGALPSALVAALAAIGVSGALAPRPQLAGLVLLVISLGAWLRTRRDCRARWWLVPLAWIWACTHGTWVVGVILGAAFVVGLAFDGQRDRRTLLRLGAIPALSLVAAALTPLGPALFANMADIRAITPFITEWAAPSIADTGLVVVVILASAVVAFWLRAPERMPWTQMFLLALGLFWALLYERTVAVGAVLLAPLAAEAIARSLGTSLAMPTRRERTAVLAGAVVSLALAAAVLPMVADRPSGPDALNPALAALPRDSVVFNVDVSGGWLMWTHPDLRPTADTRAELYGATGLREYATAMSASAGWPRLFDRHSPAAALLPVHSPLATVLQGERGWEVVDSDDGLSLLVPSTNASP